MRILYVEDEIRLAEAVIHLLQKQKIAVDWASDGETGRDLALRKIYDAIVLDIMLPGLSGWEILQSLRAHSVRTPVIILSALNEVSDKVRALDIGADDYLAKPFKTAELVARLHALERRPPLQSSEVIEFGDLVFDQQTQAVNNIKLTSKEAQLLTLLLKFPQQICSKEKILAYVWGNDTTVNDSYVEVYINHLRKKFKKLNLNVKIVTQRNLGYSIVAEDKKCFAN